jgi:ionotropic glutamate receptor
VGNDVAQKAFEVAISYISKNPNLGVSINPTMVEGNRTDSKGLLEAVCEKYAELIKTQKTPHVIFDTTKTGGEQKKLKENLENLP